MKPIYSPHKLEKSASPKNEMDRAWLAPNLNKFMGEVLITALTQVLV